MTAKGRLRQLAILLLVTAGCGATAPSLTLPAVPPQTQLPTPSPMETAPPTVAATPTRSPAATPRRTVNTGLTDLAVEVHRIGFELTRHIESFVSLGDQIVWSGGRSEGDNNLYRYVPGAAEPELLFLNPSRDSLLTSIRGSSAGYVFTDERWVAGEARGWRLWYLAAAGGKPLLLDQSTDDRLIAPTIAMNERWIAWEVIHGTWSDPSNELLVASVDDPLHPLTLLKYSGRDVYMEFPSLWADELWYGIAANDWAAGTEKPRVEMIDLTRPGNPPAAFGADQRAFMPAAGRDVVAWKGGGDPTLSALNAGKLTLYWRADGRTEQLLIPGPEELAERVSYPSVGDRFVAWWDDFRTRLYVYDLVERQFGRIAEYSSTGDELAAKPSLSGDLLVYLHYLDDGEHFLEWTELPH